MIIILLGAPGSGKGSISSVLKEKYGFIHISTGDLFRKTLSSTNNPLTAKIKEILQAGKLVDDSITNQMVKFELEKYPAYENIILDGYPRNVAQLEYLTKIAKIDYALDIQVAQEELMKRITGRRTCPVCKTIYNIYYKKPKIANLCDNDGSALVQRVDDKAETVVSRLAAYNTNNKPLVAKCKELGIYQTIDNTDFDKAIAQIKKVLKIK